MKFKVGDKVFDKISKKYGVVTEPQNTAQWLNSGVWKVPVLYTGATFTVYEKRHRLELISEPNDLLKDIL